MDRVGGVMLDRLIMELLYGGHTVIFIVDEAPAALGKWQEDGPYTASEESALYRQMLASRATPDDHPDDAEGRCRLPEWHEGECEPS